MSPSLKSDEEIKALILLKYKASVLAQKLSGQAAEALNELLQNETIQAKEFVAEFNKIVDTTSDSFIRFSWLQMSFLAVLFLVRSTFTKNLN